MSFMAIDIGNTRLKWAHYASPQAGAAVLAHGAVFLETIDALAEQDWRSLPPPSSMLGCVVAGEAVRRRVEAQLELWDLTPRWVVPNAHEAGVSNGYDHPMRLGADRWVALIGARGHVLARGPARPVLVVMIGTAVTVDALDRDGKFLGGLILPGHGIMLRALEGGTAGLRVPTGVVTPFPSNTSDALTSGGTYAIAGAIERMRRHLTERSGGEEPLVLMTGGAGWKVAPYLDMAHELVESLIFDGLLEIQSHRLAL
ncbi:type III pantothenate kinase [Ideonella sp.]|uniref:type III pantothenate kinase n=1 Tax=Ideonella sp. TaxID=1929293 RepID=UPI003BB80262